MYKKEVEILKDKTFIKRIINYNHKDIIELICNAWIDTNKNTFLEEDFSNDFVEICESIKNVDV